MPEPDPMSDSRGIPMMLRKVPDSRRALAKELSGTEAAAAGETWWELVDAAADTDQPPSAVVLTRHSADGFVHVVLLRLHDGPDEDRAPRLVNELIAALRRSEATTVFIGAVDPTTASALVAAGFVALPATADAQGYLLAL
jgi:hypothetical protein